MAQIASDPHDDDFVDGQVTFDMYSFDVDLIHDGAFSYKAFPSDFVLSILRWIDESSVPGSKAYRLTYLELTFALVRFANIRFPFEVPASRVMEMSTLSLRYERPTIDYCLKCVRGVLSACFKYFSMLRWSWG